MKDKRNASKTIGPVSARFLQGLVDRGKEIFTLDDAIEIYGHERQETSHFLRDLVNRGILARIKSGVFLILKMGQEDAQLSNWPLIAHILTQPNNYYISHYSAMRIHGMTTHALTNVTLTISKKRLPKKVHNTTYQFIYSHSDRFWGLTKHWISKHDTVWVSDIERTIFDALERPDLCGGIKEVVRGIWSVQNQINWKKIEEYGKKFHTKAAVKRLGFILELFNLCNQCIHVLNNAVSEKKDFILLDPNGPKEGKYLNRWHLRINMNIDELKMGVWG